MKMKKWLAAASAACFIFSMTACSGNSSAVYVQSVAELCGMGAIAPGDRFPGMVVSENVTEIQRDSDKTIAELLVKEGDDVTQGQQLFAYDTDELQLELDKQKLELEQLEATVKNYKEQISDLEAEKKKADKDEQLQYTVQIQSLQVDLKEAELNITAKKADIEQSNNILKNAIVTSPVAGRIQSINDSGMDNYGNSAAYITIQQAGSYRIKGTIGELQLGGIMEGTRMKIVSRTDTTQTWLGTVTLVDYENASQGSSIDVYYGSMVDSMTSSSRYPFYVELDSSDGLILGQHLYLEMDLGTDESGSGLILDASFICFDEESSAYVWAENEDKLEMRSVTLGIFDEVMNTYEILEGLSAEDYIAYPDAELCKIGATTTHEFVTDDSGDQDIQDASIDFAEDVPLEGFAVEAESGVG